MFIKSAFMVLALGTLSLVLRPDHLISNKPFIEDAYYSFTIAHNIASGRGITSDGVTPTNGFQPLFTFLTVPIFFIAGKDVFLALRLVFILQWLVYIATGFLLGFIARDGLSFLLQNKKLLFWLVALIYIASGHVFITHFNGLETGFLLFLYSLLWRYWQIRPNAGTLKEYAFLGILLGVLVLCRIDAVFLVIVISLAQFTNKEAGGFSARIKLCIIISAMAFLVSSPWWIYNKTQFGSFMPISGQALQRWEISSFRILYILSASTAVSAPWIYLSRFQVNYLFGQIASDIVRVVCIAVSLFLTYKHFQRKNALSNNNSPTRQTILFAKYIILASGVLVVWYGFSSVATYFYTRYLVPLFLPGTLLTSIVAAMAYKRFARLRWLLIAVICGPLFLSCIVFHRGTGILGNIYLSDQLALILKNVPANEYVAAGQSGTIGFFRDKVVNLDGRVNPEALSYQRNMLDYLQKRNIKWFCDWPDYVFIYLGKNPEKYGWKLIAQQGLSQLYYNKQFKRDNRDG